MGGKWRPPTVQANVTDMNKRKTKTLLGTHRRWRHPFVGLWNVFGHHPKKHNKHGYYNVTLTAESNGISIFTWLTQTDHLWRLRVVSAVGLRKRSPWLGRRCGGPFHFVGSNEILEKPIRRCRRRFRRMRFVPVHKSVFNETRLENARDFDERENGVRTNARVVWDVGIARAQWTSKRFSLRGPRPAAETIVQRAADGREWDRKKKIILKKINK